MSTLDIAIIALAALVAIGIASRMASRGRERAAEAERAEGSAPRPAAPSAAAGSDLIAVIAAAIAAESGMAPGSFRIAGISAAGGSSSLGGFNTPPWGFVDRMSRQARN